MDDKNLQKQTKADLNGIKLLTFNVENKPFYNGSCKIVINKITEKLIVEPLNEDMKILMASFDSNFLSQKNILFVESINDSRRFALIFDKQKTCKKVFDTLFREKMKTTKNDRNIEFKNKILLPLTDKLDDPHISNILKKFLSFYDKEKKRVITKLLQKHNKNCAKWIEENFNRHYVLRKRVCNKPNAKIVKTEPKEASKNFLIPSTEYESNHLTYKPNYEIIIDDQQKKRLIIFEPTNKELCYEYYPKKAVQFYCAGCHRLTKSTTVKLYNYRTKKEYVKIINFDHICELRPYNPEKFLRQLIYKPFYEFKILMKKGKSVKELYIFTTEERKYFYRFTYSNYCCTGCEARKQIVTARLFKDKNGIECIRMGINKHVCKPQVYELTAANIVESEGKNSKSVHKNSKPKVSVKLNETESEPKNKKNEHKSTKSMPKAIKPLCDIPSKNAMKLNTEYEFKLNATEFTFVPSELGYTPRLIIFAKNDKTLCYEFSSSSTAFHYCTGCSKLNNNLPNLYVRIQKNDKNEDIILTKNEKHICKPIKFDPSKYKSPTTIKPSNYMFYKNPKGIPKMIIFASKDRKLCYNYNLVNRDKIWYCSECTKQKKLISAKVRIDFDDEEYVQLGNAGHVCNPLKYSTLKSVITEIVKSTDVIVPKRIEGKGNILSEPFELRPNKDGTKDQILIIFTSNEKKQCYIFEYVNTTKSYYCKNCLKENSYVSAKICERDKKKYVMLGQKEHICKPVKYDSFK